ncbi:MAG: hypothetical protein ACYS15_07110 [Planctomycetota bacterium]|jgi:hypothetical protein
MTPATVGADDAAVLPFEDHLTSTLRAVRGSLLELIADVGADPGRPQELAQRVGLRPGLVWKVCKVLQETDAYTAIPHVPGSAGLRLFIDAFEKAGAPADAVSRARVAAEAFDRMVEIHSRDRQTLLAMLGQLAPAQQQQAQREADRKLAYQGNSSTWGVQARLNLSAQFVAPSPEAPEMVDLATVFGLHDFRRLRRTPNWVLMRSVVYDDDGTPRQQRRTPIDPEASPELPLVKDMCESLPEIREVPTRTGRQFELSDGAVGHTAAFSCVFGSYMRPFAGCYRDGANRFGEHPTMLFTPSELLIADLFVHRDLPFNQDPELVLYSRLFSGVDAEWEARESNRLPVTDPVHELGSPPVVATPHSPTYPRLVEKVCDRLGWSLEAFRGYRVVMSYPPIPTVLILRYPLPERPK